LTDRELRRTLVGVLFLLAGFLAAAVACYVLALSSSIEAGARRPPVTT
jgi:hypothetical protein